MDELIYAPSGLMPETRVNDKDVAHETQILRVVCSRFVAGER